MTSAIPSIFIYLLYNHHLRKINIQIQYFSIRLVGSEENLSMNGQQGLCELFCGTQLNACQYMGLDGEPEYRLHLMIVTIFIFYFVIILNLKTPEIKAFNIKLYNFYF